METQKIIENTLVNMPSVYVVKLHHRECVHKAYTLGVTLYNHEKKKTPPSGYRLD